MPNKYQDKIEENRKRDYDTILVRFKKETNLKDRLKDASILTRKTVNEIVQSAILEWLNEKNL